MWETRGPAPGLGLAQLVVVEPPRTMHVHPLGLLRSWERDMATISWGAQGNGQWGHVGTHWGHAGSPGTPRDAQTPAPKEEKPGCSAFNLPLNHIALGRGPAARCLPAPAQSEDALQGHGGQQKPCASVKLRVVEE